MRPKFQLIAIVVLAVTVVNVFLYFIIQKNRQNKIFVNKDAEMENGEEATTELQEFPNTGNYFLYTTIPNILKVHQQNAIRSWLVLNPPPKQIILFCNNASVVDQLFERQYQELLPRKPLVKVHPVPKEISDKRLPLLDGIFYGALERAKRRFNGTSSHIKNDYFLVYANGDIILTQSFARTMARLDEVRMSTNANSTTGPMDIFGVGRRFNIEFGQHEIPFSLDPQKLAETDAWLHQQRKEKGSLFPAYAEDVFAYTPRTFMFSYSSQNTANTERPYLQDEGIGIPAFVTTSVAWDNWLTAYAVRRQHRIVGIDISTSAIALHHNHGDLKGSHQSEWAKKNRDLLASTGIDYTEGFITVLPYVMTKTGDLKKRVIDQEEPLENYAER